MRFEIGTILLSHSLSLRDLGLPQVSVEVMPQIISEAETEQAIADTMILKINSEQTAIFDSKVACITNQETNAFFISGAVGCGKPFLHESSLHFFRGIGMKCSAVAWTGIAAMFLLRGRTSHSVFK